MVANVSCVRFQSIVMKQALVPLYVMQFVIITNVTQSDISYDDKHYKHYNYPDNTLHHHLGNWWVAGGWIWILNTDYKAYITAGNI